MIRSASVPRSQSCVDRQPKPLDRPRPLEVAHVRPLDRGVEDSALRSGACLCRHAPRRVEPAAVLVVAERGSLLQAGMPGTLVLRRWTWMAKAFSRESIAIRGCVPVVVEHVTFPSPGAALHVLVRRRTPVSRGRDCRPPVRLTASNVAVPHLDIVPVRVWTSCRDRRDRLPRASRCRRRLEPHVARPGNRVEVPRRRAVDGLEPGSAKVGRPLPTSPCLWPWMKWTPDATVCVAPLPSAS